MEKVGQFEEYADEPIRLLLDGTEAERELGMSKAYDCYKSPLLRLVRSIAPGLPLDLAGEAVQETFVALWKAIEEGEFDLDVTLAPFLIMVAKRRAYDALRKFTGVAKKLEDDLDAILEALHGAPHVDDVWKRAAAEKLVDQVIYLLRQEVAQLPDFQRQVAAILCERFPEKMAREDVCREIQRRTGVLPTVVNVKSALSEVRKKFKEILKRQGLWKEMGQ